MVLSVMRHVDDISIAIISMKICITSATSRTCLRKNCPVAPCRRAACMAMKNTTKRSSEWRATTSRSFPKAQPNVPYLLGGGLVAFEMVRQLMTHGEKLTKVIMLDTPAR